MITKAYKLEKILFERTANEKERKVWFDSTPELFIQLKDDNGIVKTVEISNIQYKELSENNGIKILSVRKVSNERKKRYISLFPKYYVEFLAKDDENNIKEFKEYLNKNEYTVLKEKNTYFKKIF